MIGRVAELRDGTFQCQFRIFLFFWYDSIADPYHTMHEAVGHINRVCPPHRSPIKRIVFP